MAHQAAYSRLQTIITAVAIAVITFITYWPSLHYDFQFDDEPNILNFYNIRHETLATLFFKNSRWISQWLNTMIYALGQFEPWWYRLINIGIHLSSGLMVYTLLLLLLSLLAHHTIGYRHRFGIATLTMILFLLHPVQTQTVSYIVQGQLEGLASSVVLLLLLTFTIAAIAPQWWQRALATIAMIGLAILSVGTKEIAIVSPLLAILIDWFFIGQGDPQKMGKRIWLHALLWLIVFSLFAWILGNTFISKAIGLQLTATNTLGNQLTAHAQMPITAGAFALSQAKVVLHYLAIYLCPCWISVDYDWQLCTSIMQLDALLPLTIIFGILAAIGWSLYRYPTNLISFGLLWFFICIAPRSSFIPACELMADYKAYLASVGWLLTLSVFAAVAWHWAIDGMDKRRVQIATIVALLSIACTLSVATILRNRVWSNTKDFWHDIVLKAPNRARAHNNYGVELMRHGHVAEATWHFKTAINLEPNSDYHDAYTNLGVAYQQAGNTDMAIVMLRHALMLNPYQPIALYSLGCTLLDKHEYDYARKTFEQALALNPQYGKALLRLAQLEFSDRNFKRAWELATTLFNNSDFDYNPRAIEFFIQLGIDLGKTEEAKQGIQRLKTVDATNPLLRSFEEQLAT